jgi:Nucleotidyl transferase of unknown function (DUF2204)
VGVAVYDEVRTVHSDGSGEPPRAQEGPDPLGLADQRVRHRCVVHEDDRPVAAGDGLEPLLEGLHLERRLAIDVAKKTFAEVRDLGSREAAHEALDADDPDLGLPDLEDEVAAVEQDDPGRSQHLHYLRLPTRVVVVVPEHGDDGDRQLATGIGENDRLLGQPVGRQVAGQQHEVGRAFERGERSRDALAKRLRAVEIARRGDPNSSRHGQGIPVRPGCPNASDGYEVGMPSSQTPREIDELVETMKRAAAALRDAGVPFMLGGGLAAWARGGPPTDHDVDFFVAEEDASRALDALVEAGMRPEQPPEEWLLKAYDGDVLVDLVFRPSGGAVGATHFERATEMEVLGQKLLVASIDDVLVMKLLALSEQEPDYSAVLALGRALREQIDWHDVRSRSNGSPFARAYFTLVEGLGIIEPSENLAA